MSELKFFRCDLEQTDLSTYINLTQDEPMFRLINTLSDVKLVAYQAFIYKAEDVLNPSQLVQEVGPKSEMPFAYEFPSSNRSIIVTLKFLNHLEAEAEPVEVDLEGSLFSSRIYVKKMGKRIGFLTIKLDFEGSTKVLRLIDKEEKP